MSRNHATVHVWISGARPDPFRRYHWGVTPATPAHLYVHVPFCAHRCGYCDFVTTSASPELHAKYVDALRYEHHHRGLPARYRTIFVGGGTPTLLELPQLRQLLTWLRGMLADGGELTVECNPETVTGELAELLAAYATRVSLGAQSMSEHVLEVLERRATPAHVQAAVQALRAAGVDQLNVDVIWGVPGQTDDDLRRDLRALLALGPDHLSAYELDFKPGTRLTRAWGSREAAVGESSDEMYELVVDELGAAEFDWYETANFARDGCQCRHNRAIWQGEAYAGIGIGAVGTTGEQRRRNKP
jgi:oxygen-independent coproporphyrinogen III oxidase